MRPPQLFMAAMFSCCGTVYAEEPKIIELQLSSATAELAGGPVKPAVSSAAVAGVIAAEEESPQFFCENIRQLLPPSKDDPKTLKPKKFSYRSGTVKQKEEEALKKEQAAVKICDIANAQRKTKEELDAGIAKKPENEEAKVKMAGYLENQTSRLEKTALKLYLDAKALRGQNSETAGY